MFCKAMPCHVRINDRFLPKFMLRVKPIYKTREIGEKGIIYLYIHIFIMNFLTRSIVECSRKWFI